MWGGGLEHLGYGPWPHWGTNPGRSACQVDMHTVHYGAIPWFFVFIFLIVTISMSFKWYHIVVLSYISLLISVV